jgi:hypothetical protein
MSKLKALPILLFFVASLAARVHAATVFAAGTKTVAACGFAVNPDRQQELRMPEI